MLKITSTGSFQNIENFIKRVQNGRHFEVLQQYGEKGVAALSAATPIETGKTRLSWRYEIKRTLKTYTVVWYNDHVEENVNIALILQYGHATGTGGWVEGRDYINPAIRSVFDEMAADFWKEVTIYG